MVRYKNQITQDMAIIAFGIIVAVFFIKTGIIVNILTSLQKWELLGSFVAGMFFTSIFTVAPATVVLGEIARVDSVFPTAFFGALGAVVGDLVIFRFVRDRLSEHLIELIKHQESGKRIRMLFRLRYFRWFTFLVGGLIIASPLPDELGISLLGFSKMRILWFIPLSFSFNFIGILLISVVAKTI